MNPSQVRVELTIDVFELTRQRALVLSDLRPSQLVKAILQEFHTLEYLGDNADDYYLVKAESGESLDAESTLDQQQIKKGDRLALVEREMSQPAGTYRPSLPIYLREPHEAKTYTIQWLPAVIGRHSENQPHDELVAVDLRAYTSGLRVSRRHVRLTEDEGGFFIENLSSNPVSLLSTQRPGPIAVTATRRRLAPGDVIRLDRSDIELKFIVRAAAAEEPAPKGDGEQTQAEQA